MNCPICNREVLPEWNTCPYCGYKAKTCSNPNCNASWLPQDAKYCPKCGSSVLSGDNPATTSRQVNDAIRNTDQPKQAPQSFAMSAPTKNKGRNTTGKRLACFIGAGLLGILGASLLLDKELHIDRYGNVYETYNFFSLTHIIGFAVLILAFILLISVFKD